MRIEKLINDNWLFSKKCTAPPEAVPAGADWEAVTLPHTWNAADGQLGRPFERGAYWYVRSFEFIDQPAGNGRLYVEIGAAALFSEIWVNGQRAAVHTGGYSAYRADITALCRKGENVLAILCDNTYNDKRYPQTGDFIFYGGLYRYVKLISVPESHFSLEDHGSVGVYIDSKPVRGSAGICSDSEPVHGSAGVCSDNEPAHSSAGICSDNEPVHGEEQAEVSGSVQLRALVQNPTDHETVGVSICDEKGLQVAECWNKAMPETSLYALIPNAKLWDGPKAPHLYTAHLTLLYMNEVVDELTVPFGIRSCALDPEKGFFLNGRSFPIRGVCRHQDYLYQGNALTKEDHERDARLIAEMGVNGVRMGHYQHSQDFIDALDRCGLCAWAEIPYFVRSWDDDAHSASLEELRELILQNYNHPSIFFWGLSNEIFLMGNDSPKLTACHEELQKAAKELDPRRFTVVASSFDTDHHHPIHNIADADAWNHYFGWYRGSFDDLGKWCDDYHAAFPDRCLSVSEYGGDAVVSYHPQTPEQRDYSEEWQVLLHESALETFAKRPYVWGSFVWNMFDFGSFFRKEGGTVGRNNKGLVTLDRKIKKDAYYVYKAWFSEDPFVHIDGRRSYARPTEKTVIRVHSNQEQVSLYINGKLFETKTGEHTFIFENVPLSAEPTAITAAAEGCPLDTITLRFDPARSSDLEFTPAADEKANWADLDKEVLGLK